MEHHDCVLLTIPVYIGSCELAVLELAHLVHATDNLLFGVAIHHLVLLVEATRSRLGLHLLWLVFRLVHNLDRSHVGVVRLIELEFDIVGE